MKNEAPTPKLTHAASSTQVNVKERREPGAPSPSDPLTFCHSEQFHREESAISRTDIPFLSRSLQQGGRLYFTHGNDGAPGSRSFFER